MSEVDTQPALIGGTEALRKRTICPRGQCQTTEAQTVNVRLVVDASGAVLCSDVIGTPNPQLNQAALEAVHSMAFDPAQKAGQPVAVRLDQPVEFAGCTTGRVTATTRVVSADELREMQREAAANRHRAGC